MSTTAGAPSRVTRSVSRARSVTSDAGTVISAAGTAATNRGRGSRRAASPATEKVAPPSVVSRSNRAYGTQGVASPSQQLLAETAMNPAVDPITNAVTGAETTPAHGNPGGLAIVNEEDEGESDGEEDDLRAANLDRVLNFQPAPQPSFFSLAYWSPRQNDDFVVGYVQEGDGPRRAVRVPHSPPLLDHWVLKWLIFCMVGLLMLNLYPALGALKTFVFPGSGVVTLQNGTHHQSSYISSYDYDHLVHRLGNVEHHLQQSSQQFDPTPKKQINWFLPGNGAVIDPHLSSPIAADECIPTWSLKPWMLFRSCVEQPASQPHMSALASWDDPVADRWCAPRSGGKLQLTVELGRTIAPTELIIEYPARDETAIGGMGAAPREVELWIQIEDDTMRATIGKAITRTYPEFFQESSPQRRMLAAKQALDTDWVPVGRWTYNIYEQQNVQTFKLPLSLLDYGIETAKVAVRVNSNWGNVKFTCINRLRLHGHDMSGLTEDLEEDPRGVRA